MAETNLIEVVIRSVDQISQDLTKIDQRLAALEKTSGETAHSTEVLNSSWAKLGGTVVALNQGIELLEKVFGPVIHLFEDAKRQAAAMEDTVVGLDSILRVFGKSIPTKDLVEFAEGLEKTLGVSDNATLGIVNLLASMTDLDGQGLKRVAQGVIALSTAFNKDLGGSAYQVAALLNGLTDRIRGTTIALAADTPLVEREAKLMAQLAPLIEVAQKRSQDYVGQQRTLATATESLIRAMGEPLLSTFKALNPPLIEFIGHVTDFVKAHPDLVKALNLVAVAVSTLALAMGALAAASFVASTGALAKILGILTALASTPAGLAILAAALGLAGVALVKFGKDAHDAALKADPKAIQQEIDQLTASLSKLSKTEQGGELGQGIIAKIKNLEDLKKVLAQAAGTPEGERAEAAPAGGEGGRVLKERLEQAGKQVKDFAEKAQTDLTKARSANAAEAQKFLFDTTGSFEALQKSFALTEQGIVAASGQGIEQQIKQMAKQLNLTPEQLEGIAGPLRKALGEQGNLQALQNRRALQKAIFDQQQAAIEANLALNKALEAQADTLVNREKQKLQVLKDQNAPLYEQAAQMGVIADAEGAAALLRIKNATTERDRLQKLVDDGKVLDNLRTQTNNKIADQNNLIAQQRDLLDQIIARQEKETRDVLDQAVAKNIKARQTDLEAASAEEQSRLDTLNYQLKVLKDQGAPYNEILSITAQIDALERSILAVKIAQKEIEAAALPAKIKAGEATQADLDLANAQLAALKNAAKITGDLTRQTLLERHRLAESMADQLAGDFVDRFIAIMGDEKAKLEDFFVNLGKTLVSQFLQAMLAKLLLSPLEDMLAQWGANATEQYKKFGAGGALFGGILDLLGVGRQAAPTMPGAGAAIITGAAQRFEVPELPTPDFEGWTFAIEKGLGTVNKTVVQGLSESFTGTAIGFERFFGSLGRLITDLLDSLTTGGKEGGGGFGIFKGILGIFGSIFGMFGGSNPYAGGYGPAGPPNLTHAHGGMFIPRGMMRAFAGGGITTGPVLGVIGEEGPEIVARMKPARAQDSFNQQQRVQVQINGDIIPRRPDMKPEDVVRIVYDNMDRGGPLARGVTTVLKRNR